MKEANFLCGGWDSNPRTPSGQGPKPCAFDLAWQPPLAGIQCNRFDKASRPPEFPGSTKECTDF